MNPPWELLYSSAFVTVTSPQTVYVQVDDLKTFEAIRAAQQDFGRVKTKTIDAGPQRIIFQYWDRRVVDDVQAKFNRIAGKINAWEMIA